MAHEIWVDWRDVDPETIDFVSWLGVEKGQCGPVHSRPGRSAKYLWRKKARLAMPKSKRVKLSATETNFDLGRAEIRPSYRVRSAQWSDTNCASRSNSLMAE